MAPRHAFEAGVRGLVLLALATACAPLRPAGPVPEPGLPAIEGRVVFPVSYKTAATISEIATAATVSLIDPALNKTLATTVTSSSGVFSLQALSAPTPGTIFYLEAVKGLDSNLVGSDAARVRTLIRFNSQWSSISAGGGIVINSSTTALSAIVSLRQGTSPVDPAKLIGKLLVGVTSGASPDTFQDTGTGVAPTEFLQVRGLLASALLSDADPLDSIIYNGTSYSLKAGVAGSSSAPVINYLDPKVATVGDTVSVFGSSFSSSAMNNVVTFAQGATASVIQASPTLLKVIVPQSAVTGDLTVSVAGKQSSAAMTIVPPVGGGFSP